MNKLKKFEYALIACGAICVVIGSGSALIGGGVALCFLAVYRQPVN